MPLRSTRPALVDKGIADRGAAELLASDDYSSTTERVIAFVKQGGGCRATFFNYRRSLII